MNRWLPESSAIYELLAPLRFMNLLTGEGDLTADKDYKHVMKRIRCKELRPSGIVIFDQIITPQAIQLHLLESGKSKTHVGSVFQPNDKQDVPLALLHFRMSFPSAAENKTPGFRSTHEALRILGQVFMYLLHPYICIDLSLSEQLEYLSAAAHLMLLLYRVNENKFFPKLLYTDIMIMIKNVYFCVAKAKVNNPHSQFFLVLLGTDRLETLFGIIRSMIGNDCGVDVLQLGECSTGTTEVADILGRYPAWDKPPRHLNMPLIDKDGAFINQNNAADHANPGMWKADLSLAFVNVQTCWQRGPTRPEENPALQTIRPQIHELRYICDPSIDILSPLGTPLIGRDCDGDDDDDDDEEAEDISACRNQAPAVDRMEGAGSMVEMEDAVAEEDIPETAAVQKFLPYVVLLGGKKMNKGKLLAMLLKHKKVVASSDCLKRYQDISHFDTTAVSTTQARFEVKEGDVMLVIGDSIVSLLQCENQPFLCLGEVLGIQVDLELIDELPITALTDLTVSVTYQLIKLVPATKEDDPDSNNDWCSRHGTSTSMMPFQKTVPGQLVQPINPTISQPPPPQGELMVREWPFYLLDIQVLIALTASYLNQLGSEDAKLIPSIPRSTHFPYTKAGADHLLNLWCISLILHKAVHVLCLNLHQTLC
jgi:hypothetical protein